jgi:thiamine biosynthesis lipoprotein
MGTTAHVLIGECRDGDEMHHLDDIQTFIEHLERLWSRFLTTSEVTLINEHCGLPVPVSRQTFDVVRMAVDGWHATQGRFDPSVGTAMIRCGYDRTFDAIAGQQAAATAVLTPSAGCSAIDLDETALTVTIPFGVQLDLGGIGKGRAADLAADRLSSRGIGTACINLGGDLRCIGGAELHSGWVVDVENPFDPSASVAWLGLTEGAVATSARTRRRWLTSRGPVHHLVDPSTGQSAETGLAQVTVLAAEAAPAEVLAKAAFLGGPDSGRELVEARGAAALFVTDGGDVIEVGPIARFRR